MAAVLVDGHGWGREVRIGERTHGYGPEFVQTGNFPVDCGATLGAEIESNDLAGVTGAPKYFGLAFYPNLRARPARLLSKGAAGALLALQAMAD